MTNRDLDRYTWAENGTIDEIILTDAFVHLEQLDKNNYMLIIENDEAHFHLTIRKPVPFEVIINDEPHAGEWRHAQ